VEETCIDLRTAACCQSSRSACCLPLVCYRSTSTAGPLRGTSRRCVSPAAANGRTAYCENCAIRLCRCHGYRAGPRRAVARRCAPSLRRHDLGQVLGNLFALLFSGCAARSSFVQGAARRVGLAGPPSQSAFTRSQCVGPHATYPASCAVRMRPSSVRWKKSSHGQVSARSQSVSSRTLGQNRPQTQWISRVQRPHFGSL
jgi:hypothetical protein